MQRKWRIQALVQACPKEEYEGEIFNKGTYHIAPQIQSDHSFEGNWWYIWFKGDLQLRIGDTIQLEKTYTVEDIHIYRNYKRGSVLLKE
jgi:hypothetical protein